MTRYKLCKEFFFGNLYFLFENFVEKWSKKVWSVFQSIFNSNSFWIRSWPDPDLECFFGILNWIGILLKVWDPESGLTTHHCFKVFCLRFCCNCESFKAPTPSFVLPCHPLRRRRHKSAKLSNPPYPSILRRPLGLESNNIGFL
jgi:hypothetical protein